MSCKTFICQRYNWINNVYTKNGTRLTDTAGLIYLQYLQEDEANGYDSSDAHAS